MFKFYIRFIYIMDKNLYILNRIAHQILIFAFIIVVFIRPKFTFIEIIIYEIIVIISGIIAIYTDPKVTQKTNNKENNK